ncbi:MAG: spermidine synthase [Acidobacteria bacterium]|nr:spermidine synthase [Acidobacteriota bacterium]
MQPYELLDSFTTPDGNEMTLYKQGNELFVNYDGRELMSTRTHRTECTLARVACEELAGVAAPKILIGGLGLGYTVRAALDTLPEDATIVTAEVYAKIVHWNREHSERLGANADDPRVEIRLQDVYEVVGERRAFDAILLDVDNGPIAETLESNSRLYEHAGLLRLKRALRRDGLLAVWSAHPDPAFERRMAAAGFLEVQAPVARTGKSKGARHVIFLGRAD